MIKSEKKKKNLMMKEEKKKKAMTFEIQDFQLSAG